MSPTLFPFNCKADETACGSSPPSSSSSSASSSARVKTVKKTTANASRTKNFIFAIRIFSLSIWSGEKKSVEKRWKTSLQLKTKLTFFCSHFFCAEKSLTWKQRSFSVVDLKWRFHSWIPMNLYSPTRLSSPNDLLSKIMQSALRNLRNRRFFPSTSNRSFNYERSRIFQVQNF